MNTCTPPQLVSKRDDNVCNFLEGGSLIGRCRFSSIAMEWFSKTLSSWHMWYYLRWIGLQVDLSSLRHSLLCLLCRQQRVGTRHPGPDSGWLTQSIYPGIWRTWYRLGNQSLSPRQVPGLGLWLVTWASDLYWVTKLFLSPAPQVFVETLDKCFENVCELDLIFHMDKVPVWKVVPTRWLQNKS